MSIISRNAELDPEYSPYCGRCSGLVRMVKVAPFLWRHRCGAVHDERCRAGISFGQGKDCYCELADGHEGLHASGPFSWSTEPIAGTPENFQEVERDRSDG